ncbi:hypothetical protein Dsin_005924 [Dipteronia sinensis]|uniref:Uncharacterized protein n=1 Tax=Dipteronia sinensis TaxID=43782 RepID=A0AAE0AYQ0_9ROSI|nr:hypothetical protein Dsin_005924 [Dipteronia sinensis]
MLEVYGAMALAGNFICSIIGIDSMGGFHPSLDAILEGLGYAAPPIIALLFILDIGVSRDIFELKITSQLTEISLVINADDEVNFVLMHNKSEWPEIHVEVVDKFVHQTPRKARNTTINLECTPPPYTSTSNLHSPAGTPHYKSVSGSNHPHGSVPSPNTTSPGNNQGTLASTNKHVEVDDTDDSESSDTEDESCSEGDTSNDPNGVLEVPHCGGQVETGAIKAPTDGEEE